MGATRRYSMTYSRKLTPSLSPPSLHLSSISIAAFHLLRRSATLLRHSCNFTHPFYLSPVSFPENVYLSWEIVTVLMNFELVEQETEELSSSGKLLLQLAGAGFNVERPTIERELAPELSTGLSLGGCFAVETREMRLLWSSSNGKPEFPRESAQFVRTCSLPMDSCEGSQKRKEIQSLERLEVKRKRAERRGSWKLPIMGERSRFPEEEPSEPAELRRSSSDFDGRGLEGSDLSSLSNSSTVTSLPEISPMSAVADPLLPRPRSLNSFLVNDEVLKRRTGNLNRPKEMGRNLVDAMPCVSVIGAAPHGRRIEGFLYKYGRGEEVRIVCVCHGSFFTPAEFVNHAGGGDAAHPLRQIVVNPSPSVYY